MNTQTHAPGSPEAFLAGCLPYHKKEGDIDLIAICREELAKACGNDPATMSAFNNNINISSAVNMTTEIQRYKLNMFLNSQYAVLSGDISKHVGYILRMGDAETWLNMFRQYHLPTMLNNGLPVEM